MNVVYKSGAIAQLVEHLHGMQGVSGSSPLGSIWVLAAIQIFSVNLLIKLKYLIS